MASNFSVLVFLSKNGLKPDLSEQLGADHREARTAPPRGQTRAAFFAGEFQTFISW